MASEDCVTAASGRRRDTFTSHYSSASLDSSTGFWSDGGSSPGTTATSVFSSSPCSSSSICHGSNGTALLRSRQRADTGFSFTLESLAESPDSSLLPSAVLLNADSQPADPDSRGAAGENGAPDFSIAASIAGGSDERVNIINNSAPVQTEQRCDFPTREDSELQVEDSVDRVRGLAGPSDLTLDGLLPAAESEHGHGPAGQRNYEASTDARPGAQSKKSAPVIRLLRKTRERAASLSRLSSPSASSSNAEQERRNGRSSTPSSRTHESQSLASMPLNRPSLERREATTSPDQREGSSFPNVLLRSKKLRQLQGRFARSAPTTPALTPSPSTDRVNLWRSSRPGSTIFHPPSAAHLTGSGSTTPTTACSSRLQQPISAFTMPAAADAQTGSSHGRPSSSAFAHPASVATSPLSSCNVSYRVAAQGSITLTFVDASAEAFFDPQSEASEQFQEAESEADDGEDAFEEALPKDLFDSRLPREVRIRIFSMVVRNSIAEHDQAIREIGWNSKRASQERWVGRAGGLRELVKLTRVSREWRDLAFDGQLWQDVQISRDLGNDTFSTSGLIRLANHSGSFLRRLDLRGFANLRNRDLEALTDACTAYAGITSLEYLDLTGCRALTSKGLHYLLAHSPGISILKLRSLPAVISSTCDVVIASALHRVTHLDVSLCRNLLAAAILDIRQPSLRTLIAAKIPSMDNQTVAGLPAAFPLLEVLDIGYSRMISDDSFKRWTTSSSLPPPTVDENLPLKALRLSGCARLTDQTCLSLAGRVSHLERLELANIGVNLREPGLLKLLGTCSNLRKLDLEDATSLTDRTVAALSPASSSSSGGANRRSRHGTSLASSPLEHLLLTNVPEITEAALIRLVRSCPHLRVMDVSNSAHVADPFLKAFLQHVRRNKVLGAEVSAVDCRGLGRQTFKEWQASHRPRRGYRDYNSRHFEYLDPVQPSRQPAECDTRRTVLHSFWSWQQLDEAEAGARAARTARLAIEGGANPNGSSTPAAVFLRHARRASSFGFRGNSNAVNAVGGVDQADNRPSSGGSCIIS